MVTDFESALQVYANAIQMVERSSSFAEREAARERASKAKTTMLRYVRQLEQLAAGGV